MEFYFNPSDEREFKGQAKGNIVRTIIFDIEKQEIVNCFSRQVRKIWEQTCKNNIETDHRIKELSGDNFQIYSWISTSKNNFNLPCFLLKNRAI